MALTDQDIDSVASPWDWLNINCTEHRNAFARAIESAACAERDARIAEFVTALDEEKVISHIGVFNLGDDPRKAIKDLMQWSQGVGEYFANEKLKERIAELERQLAEARKDAERYRWLRDWPEWEPFDSSWLIRENIYGCPALEMDAAIDNAMQKG